MGNVVVTVVKYSALCVYSISIQPISKLYLFFFNQIVLLSLRKKTIIYITDQYLVRHPGVLRSLLKIVLLTNVALH